MMNPKKNVIRHVDITVTNCAPNTHDTGNAVRKRTTREGERYNIKVTGNAKSEDVDLSEASVAFSRAATG